MHFGPYATEPATVERMKAISNENGYRDCVGHGAKHHEIYIGQPAPRPTRETQNHFETSN